MTRGRTAGGWLASSSLALMAAAAAQQPAAVVAGGGVEHLLADWDQRDLEGRWVAYRADMERNAGDANRSEKWVAALAARGDVELLEWITLFEGWGRAGPQLVAMDAPQWMRAAHWNLRSMDSHNSGGAGKALTQAAALAHGWFLKYPVAQGGRGAAVFAKVQEFEPRDPGAQLPPLDGMQVIMPFLEAGGEVRPFGARLQAEPGVRYVHQVVRALRALPVWGELDELHARKVLALARHPLRAIRSQALAAFTTMPGHLVPWRDLEPLTQAEDVEDRRQALLAWSYAEHPQVLLDLHLRAAAAGDPARDVAMSRLGDRGIQFTLSWLRADTQRRGAAAGILPGLGKRLTREGEWLGQHLGLLGWAEHVGHPLTSELREFLEAELAGTPAADRAALLAALRRTRELPAGLSAAEAGPAAAAVLRVLDRWQQRDWPR